MAVAFFCLGVNDAMEKELNAAPAVFQAPQKGELNTEQTMFQAPRESELNE